MTSIWGKKFSTKIAIATIGLVVAVSVIALFIGASRKDKDSLTALDCHISHQAGARNIWLLGNSLLHDFHWPLNDATVVNCAKRGHTVHEFLSRWNMTQLPTESPEYVVIAFGTVEVIRAEQDSRYIREFMTYYPQLLTDLQSRWPTAKIIVNLLPDINTQLFGRPDLDLQNIEILNQFIAQNSQCPTCNIIDVGEILLRDEESFSEQITYDGVHFTEYAYKKWLAELAVAMDHF